MFIAACRPGLGLAALMVIACVRTSAVPPAAKDEAPRPAVERSMAAAKASPPAPGTEDQDDCEPRLFNAQPGNHDRFRFEGPGGKIGFKNAAGNVVIPPRFFFAYEFSAGGVAGVADEDGFAFITVAGTVIARAFAFDNGPDYFSAGRARIVDARQKIGFIDEAGGIAIAPRFDFASPFCGDRAAACMGCRAVAHGEHTAFEGGRWGFIDRSGAVVVPFKFDEVGRFEGNHATVTDGGRRLIIDRQGRVVGPAPP